MVSECLFLLAFVARTCFFGTVCLVIPSTEALCVLMYALAKHIDALAETLRTTARAQEQGALGNFV